MSTNSLNTEANTFNLQCHWKLTPYVSPEKNQKPYHHEAQGNPLEELEKCKRSYLFISCYQWCISNLPRMPINQHSVALLFTSLLSSLSSFFAWLSNKPKHTTFDKISDKGLPTYKHRQACGNFQWDAKDKKGRPVLLDTKIVPETLAVHLDSKNKLILSGLEQHSQETIETTPSDLDILFMYYKQYLRENIVKNKNYTLLINELFTKNRPNGTDFNSENSAYRQMQLSLKKPNKYLEGCTFPQLSESSTQKLQTSLNALRDHYVGKEQSITKDTVKRVKEVYSLLPYLLILKMRIKNTKFNDQMTHIKQIIAEQPANFILHNKSKHLFNLACSAAHYSFNAKTEATLKQAADTAKQAAKDRAAKIAAEKQAADSAKQAAEAIARIEELKRQLAELRAQQSTAASSAPTTATAVAKTTAEANRSKQPHRIQGAAAIAALQE